MTTIAQKTVFWIDKTVFKQYPGIQKIIANFGWLVADKILRMIVGLFVGVWVARYLGPQQFGLWNYATAFSSLFISFAALGLDGIVVRELVKRPGSQNELLGTAFILKLIGAFVTLLVTIFVITLIRIGDNLTLWLVGISAAGFIFQSINVIDFYFQAKVQSKYVVYATNGSFLIMTLVKIALLLVSASLICFAWVGLCEVILTAFFLVLAYTNDHQSISKWRYNGQVAKELLKDSWPLIFSGLAIMVQARIDQVMLGSMIGDVEVGQYSAAMRLIEVFAFLPMIIASTLGPYVTKAKNLSMALYYERMTNIYRIMFITFLLTSIPIFIFGNQVTLLLYGNEFDRAGLLFSLFGIRLFFANFGIGKSIFITNENLFKYSLVAAIVGSLVNIVGNLILIPVYHSEGAIISTILSFFITIFLLDIFFEKTRVNLKLMLLSIATPYKLKIN